MAGIFLEYASQDHGFASDLSSALKGLGHRVWLRERGNTEIQPGAAAEYLIDVFGAASIKDLEPPPADAVDWQTIQRLERDICFLYHELADYSYIMGDLAFGHTYRLPYWEYLDVREISDQAERAFVRDGCLVMMLTMAYDTIDGSGAYVPRHVSECRAALARLMCEDEDTRKLAKTVQLGVEIAARGAAATTELEELSAWVHHRYVRGYFRGIARNFDTNPYYTG